MDFLETRELRYFIAVGEELHFGRAAKRLMIAQPALTKAIQKIEAQLGVTLLVRSSRRVALTPSGTVLLEQGRHAVNAVASAVQSTRRAAAGEPLRLVLKPGGDANLLSTILENYAQRPDTNRVDILFSAGTDRVDYLHDGRADVALLYVPFDDLTGLDSTPLHWEDRVAVLPEGHRFADRRAVRLDELEGETFPRWRGVPSSAAGPEVTDIAEMFPLVVVGRMVAILPRSLVSPAPPGVVCVTVEGAELSQIVVARVKSDQRPAVMDFMEAATDARREPRLKVDTEA